MKKFKISIIGAGNVGSQFAKAVEDSPHRLLQVFSRTLTTAKEAAGHADAIDKLADLSNDADVVFLCVPDAKIAEVAEQLPSHDALVVHVSGSVSSLVLEPFSQKFGVLYPLQTMKKGEEVNFREIPFFITTSDSETENMLRDIAFSFTDKVESISDEKRLQLHLVAVILNNFTNHLAVAAADLSNEFELDWSWFLPLIQKTCFKISHANPAEAQTGPAVREDQTTIQQHLEMLKQYPQWEELYETLTKSIIRKKKGF